MVLVQIANFQYSNLTVYNIATAFFNFIVVMFFVVVVFFILFLLLILFIIFLVFYPCFQFQLSTNI